jgi:hypothetical protein
MMWRSIEPSRSGRAAARQRTKMILTLFLSRGGCATLTAGAPHFAFACVAFDFIGVPTTGPAVQSPEIAIQPPISTIPCEILYLLANPVLFFGMFAPRAASLPRPTRGHFANRSSHLILNALNCGSSLPFNIPTFKPSNRQPTPFSCHAAPPQLTENTAALDPSSANLDAPSSLTPLFATLTKNTRGWGTSASFLCVSSAYSASQRYPFPSSTAVSCKLLPVSSPLVTTPNSSAILTSEKHTHNPFRIRTSKTQHLKGDLDVDTVNRGV